MGLVAQADGLPRIAGRLMGLLVLEGGPLAFGELASRVKVSRGSVSSNARLLEAIGIVERVAKPGERGDYFRRAGDPYVRLLRGIEERSARALRLVETTREAIDRGPPEERAGRSARLGVLAAFYAALHAAMEELRQKLR